MTARIANGRVQGLIASLDQLKKQASSNNGQDVQLRALEREAKAQRDLLESYLAKYREATTRENIEAAPADGRIISRASVSNTPAYPKKLPIVLIATLATLLLTSGAIATGELLRMTAPRASAASRGTVAGQRCGAPSLVPELPAPAVEAVDVPEPMLSEARVDVPRRGWISRPKNAAVKSSEIGRRSRRRGRSGAQGDRARHGVGRKHHADRADAGAADGAAGENRRRRSLGRPCR